MFGIKRKGKEKSAKLHKAIESFLSPIVKTLSEKLKLKRKIRIANFWARKHPKKLMIYYLVFALSLIVFSLMTDFSSGKEKVNTINLKTIPSMSHRLQSLNNTEIQNEIIKMELSELGAKGMKLYNELDSMIKIPNKTHSDSLRIYSIYQILNNTFNKHGHELQKD